MLGHFSKTKISIIDEVGVDDDGGCDGGCGGGGCGDGGRGAERAWRGNVEAIAVANGCADVSGGGGGGAASGDGGDETGGGDFESGESRMRERGGKNEGNRRTEGGDDEVEVSQSEAGK